MLNLTHVTLKTRQVILQDADFTFKKGRIYGLLAINGSGKTTLFRAMSKGLILIDGHIAVDGGVFRSNGGQIFGRQFDCGNLFGTRS